MSFCYEIYKAKNNLKLYIGKSKRPKRKFTKHAFLWRIIVNSPTGMLKNSIYNFFRRRRFYE